MKSAGKTGGKTAARQRKVAAAAAPPSGDGDDGASSNADAADVAEQLLALDEAFAFMEASASPLQDEAEAGQSASDPLDPLAAVQSLKGHQDAVRGVAFDAASNTLFTASWDGSVLAWDMVRVEQIAVLPHGTWVNAVAVSRVAAQSWQPQTTTASHSTSSRPDDAMAIRGGGLIDDALRVITGAEDGNLTVWQAFESATGREFGVAHQVKLSHGAVTALCAHDGSGVVFASAVDRVVAFSLSSGSVVRSYKTDAEAVAVLAIDELLYCGCDDGRITVFDVVGGFALRQLSGHKGPVRHLMAAEAYNSLYSAGEDGTLRVWLLSTGQCTRTWKLHRRPVSSLAIHVGDRDRFLYSASTDGIVRCTRLATGTSVVVRHCAATAMLAIDVVDPEVALQRRIERGMAKAGGLLHGGYRRMSVQEQAQAATSTGGTLICADYAGRLFAFPTAASERTVTTIDADKVSGKLPAAVPTPRAQQQQQR